MTCPFCRAPLSVREYAWTHTHPTKWGRWIGTAMMMVGAFTVVAGIAEITGYV